MTHAAREGADDSGLYAVVMLVARPALVRAGALGKFTFEAGTYVYIGSAQRGMAKRVARHRARVKPMRWHVDYFRAKARWAGAVAYPGMAGECELAAGVMQALDGRVAARRFGASDCRCPGHLVMTAASPERVMKTLENIGVSRRI